MSNQTWIFSKYPSNDITSETFQIKSIDAPKEEDLQDKQVLVKLKYVSVDPYLRARLNPVNYFTPISIGQSMSSTGLAEVVASKDENFKVGELVNGFLDWTELQIVSTAGLNKVDTFDGKIRPSMYLGLLGITGLSAYFPIIDIAQPKAGESVFISGAAGGVGMAAGQIFKIMGCKVYGSAGSDDKVAFLKSIGFDGAFNYKTENLNRFMKQNVPNGLDIYWDNVGGKTLDDTLLHMRDFGRIVACGSISQYNVSQEEKYGVKNLFVIVTKRIRMQGFLLFDYAARFGEGIKQLVEWNLSGKLQDKETIVEGFQNIPNALMELFKGGNTGKMVVKM